MGPSVCRTASCCCGFTSLSSWFGMGYNCTMKKLLIVANWKSHKTVSQAKEWLEGFRIEDVRFKNKEIIICPPFTLLPFLRSYFLHHTSDIKLGGQDVSLFEEGAYTGAISARQVKDFADYAII